MKKTVTVREVFIWNFVGSLSNSLVSFVLLMIVTRLFDYKYSDIFSLAWAIAQLMVTIGTFQVRVFQATDTLEQHKFNNYLALRIFTTTAMCISSLVYVIYNGYDKYKSTVILLLCVYRAIDAFADVYEGYFQQKERLDLSGKALSCRVWTSAIAFLIVSYFTRSLILSSGIMVITAIVCVVLTDFIWLKKLGFSKISLKEMNRFKDNLGLLKKCIPLFINAFCITVIYNAAKVCIEEAIAAGELFEGAQTYYSVLFMPAFVINLFLIVLRPLITKLAITWNLKKIAEFRKLVFKIILGIMGFSIVVIIGGAVIGVPILSILYKVKLRNYVFEFVLILLAGGFNAMLNIFDNSITIMRKQYLLLIPYIICTLVIKLVTPALVDKFKLTGAAYSYLFAMIFLLIMLFGMYLYNIIKEEKNTKCV